MNLDLRLIEASYQAVQAGMRVVRRFQLLGGTPSEVKESDQTLVTQADRESGLAVRNAIRCMLPEVTIFGEDMDNLEQPSSLVALLDPLDGTRAFTNGLTTSTVIAGIYDKTSRRLLSCVIGEAISDRMWLSSSSAPTCDKTGRPVRVWDGPLDRQSTVLLDVSHGFKSRGRQILSDQQVAELFGSLNTQAVIMMPGSNGLHQALVANGGEKLAGSITTAIGGPWDVCGALLVLKAGGAAQGLSMTDDRQLIRVNALDVLSYDMLVTGNSQETVDSIVNTILAINGQR